MRIRHDRRGGVGGWLAGVLFVVFLFFLAFLFVAAWAHHASGGLLP